MVLLNDILTPVGKKLFEYFQENGISVRVIDPEAAFFENSNSNVTYVQGELQDSKSWPDYFKGVDTLIYHPFPGHGTFLIESEMLYFAQFFGVKKVIRFEELNLRNFDGKKIAAAPNDDYLLSLGLNMTMVFHSILMDSILEQAENIRHHNTLDAAVIDHPIGFVSADDVVSGILSILKNDIWMRKLAFTGSQAITFGQIKDWLEATTKKQLQLNVLAPDQIGAKLKAAQLRPDLLDFELNSIAFVRSGATDQTTNHLNEVGIQPLPIENFLQTMLIPQI